MISEFTVSVISSDFDKDPIVCVQRLLDLGFEATAVSLSQDVTKLGFKGFQEKFSSANNHFKGDVRENFIRVFVRELEDVFQG